MAKYLDSDGLLYFWQKLKTVFAGKVDKVEGKGLSTNDYTGAEKSKLAGIATNANNYTHPASSGNKHIPSGGSAGQILRWAVRPPRRTAHRVLYPSLQKASRPSFCAATVPGPRPRIRPMPT